MGNKKTKKGKSSKAKVRGRSVSSIDRRSLFLWVGAITGMTFIALWPVISAEFTELDDKHLIVNAVQRYLRNPWIVWKANMFTPHYKPLVLLSWTIEESIFGLNAAVLHFNNLLLHAINSVLAFFLVRKLALKFAYTREYALPVAGFTGLLFAVHPLHVESVAWAIERKDVMYTCFFFLGLLAYLKYLDRPSMKWMALTTAAFAGSVLSKSPGIMFPFVLLLVDWAYGRPLKLKAILEKWPVLVVFLGILILYGVFGGGGGTSAGATEGSIAKMVSEKPVSNVEPLISLPAFYAKIALIGLKGVFWYLHSYIPAGLSIAYPYREWLPGTGHLIHIFPILLLAGAFVVWWYRKKNPFLFFTHTFFFLALAPAMIRTGLGKGIFLSDRYVYLPLLGLCFFIMAVLLIWLARRGLKPLYQYGIAAILIAGLGIQSFMQARTWRTGETLWTNVIDKYPSIDYAYVNRAIWYRENNQTQKALEDLNQALALERFDDQALIHRGTLLRQNGNLQQALADFEEALSKKPNNEHALNGKGNVLFELGRYAEAEETYTRGLAIKPRMVTLLINRAAARYFLRKHAEALADLAAAERLAPNTPGIFQKRTVIAMAMGDYETAVVSAHRTAQYDPKNHANYGDLGSALQNLGRHQEAIEAFSQALRIFDRGERYYRGRARSYEAIGNIAAAQQDRDRANSL
jgi:protein O-mannosyl-transferase